MKVRRSYGTKTGFLPMWIGTSNVTPCYFRICKRSNQSSRFAMKDHACGKRANGACPTGKKPNKWTKIDDVVDERLKVPLSL